MGLFEEVPTNGEVNKGPTSNWAVDHKADAAAHHAKYTDAEARTAVSAGLKLKVIEMGDWNMDTTTTLAVAHGLTLSKIRALDGLVRSDDASTFYPPSRIDSSGLFTTGWGIESVDGTNVNLRRIDPGSFSNTSFDSTSFNRGWVLVWYDPT